MTTTVDKFKELELFLTVRLFNEVTPYLSSG